MPAILDAVFYSEDAPTFERRNGMFHVAYTIGAIHAEFVLRPSVFYAALADANEIAAERESAEIIPVVFDSKFERVYPVDKIA